MASGTFTVSGLSSSEPTGERVFGPVTIQGVQVIGETLAVPLTQGDNTFSVPAGATACWIQAPTNGAAALTLRTNVNSTPSGPDTMGLPINGQGLPMIYPFPSSAPATLIINSSSGQVTPLTIAFI